MTSLQDQITAHLTSHHLVPNPTWLASTILPTLRPNTPLIAGQKTALFRMLASDLTSSTAPLTVFPTSITSADTRETILPRTPIAVQVLDVEDLGHSRWSQVERLEAVERGETRKGQEIIRVVAEEQDGGGEESAGVSAGPHKVLLQDGAGTMVRALELTSVPGVGVQMAMGCKMVLREGLVVARGVVLLEKGKCEVLGGKVEVWDRKWREDRKRVLKEKAGWRDDGTG